MRVSRVPPGYRGGPARVGGYRGGVPREGAGSTCDDGVERASRLSMGWWSTVWEFNREDALRRDGFAFAVEAGVAVGRPRASPEDRVEVGQGGNQAVRVGFIVPELDDARLCRSAEVGKEIVRVACLEATANVFYDFRRSKVVVVVEGFGSECEFAHQKSVGVPKVRAAGFQSVEPSRMASIGLQARPEAAPLCGGQVEAGKGAQQDPEGVELVPEWLDALLEAGARGDAGEMEPADPVAAWCRAERLNHQAEEELVRQLIVIGVLTVEGVGVHCLQGGGKGVLGDAENPRQGGVGGSGGGAVEDVHSTAEMVAEVAWGGTGKW